MPRARYDDIGRLYGAGRGTDQRLADALSSAVIAGPVLNIGAGTGNYEAAIGAVAAVEPSRVMIDQRGIDACAVAQARAEALPFADDSFGTAIALSTVHHWSDVDLGLAEMRRVADRQLVLMTEPVGPGWLWLADEYLPEIYALSTIRDAPTVTAVAARLAGRIVPFPVPHDMAEASGGVFWARPEHYLRPESRAAMSIFTMLDEAVVDSAMARLRHDLSSGAWDRRHGHLRHLDHLDLGYRIVVANG